MRNKSTRQKGKKNFNFTISKFRAQRYELIYDQQRLESLEEKKAAQMQTWCQKDLKLYSKGRPAGKLTWCEPSGDHLDYR